MQTQAYRQFGLNKLLVAVLLLVVAYRLFSHLPSALLLGPWPSGPSANAWLARAYFEIASFSIAEMVVFLFAYRPMRSLFEFRGAGSARRPGRLHDCMVGIGLGALAVAISAPFVSGGHARVVFNALFHRATAGTSLFVASFLVFGVLVPLAAALVFFGVVMRALMGYANPMPSLFASALLMAYLWPAFNNSLIAVTFGVMTGVAYWRRGLLSAVIASISMSTLAIVYGLWAISHWG